MSKPDVTKVEKEFDTVADLIADIDRSEVEARAKLKEHQAYIQEALGPMPQDPVALAKFVVKVINFLAKEKQDVN